MTLLGSHSGLDLPPSMVSVAMSLLLPLERLLVNLEGDVDPGYVFIYVPRDKALQGLKEQTGQDFGYDAKRWREWLQANGMVPRRDIPAEMLQILEDGFPPGYLRREKDREAARRLLKDWTSQDFGYDAKQWRDWLQRNGYIVAHNGPGRTSRST
jgi:hypothetical protein